MSSDVQLPIKDIRNANPVWLRRAENLQPLDKLEKSLRQHGMILPVLLRSDFVMLDGARRLLAAERLGWTQVPVIIAHNWDTVVSYYAKLNQLTVEGFEPKPLRWVELNELWSQLLKPVHHSKRIEQSRTERIRRSRLRRQGASEAEIYKNKEVYTGYTNDLAAMFGCRPIHVKLIRDIFNTYFAHRGRRPEMVEPFEKLVAMAEDLGIQTTSSVRHFTRSIAHDMPLDQALTRAEQSLVNAHTAPWRLTNKTKKEPVAPSASTKGPTGPPTTQTVLRNLVTMLEQLSREADRFHEFELGVTPEIVSQTSAQIKSTITRINAMRRRLEAHGDSLGESEK